MASLSRVNVQVGFNGQAAMDGIKQLGNEAQKLGQKKAGPKITENMNALQVKDATRKWQDQQRRLGMSAVQIEKDMQFEALKTKMKGMNALEREEFKAAERTRNRRKTMSAAAIKAEMDQEKKAANAKAEAERKAAEKQAAQDKWRSMSAVDKFRSMTSGMTDMKTFLDFFVVAPAKAAVSFVQMGAQMETLQIQVAYAAESWGKAGQALENLQTLAAETGQSFDSLSGGFRQFTSAGLSAQSAVTIMGSLTKGAEIIGGGAAGMQAMSGAMRELMRTATASEGAILGLQDQGLEALQALGQELSKITGKSYTTEEALRAIRRGAVSSSMAMEAIQNAANSPKAMEANKRFLGSFEGQLSRLKQEFERLTRDLSRMFLEAFDWGALMAGLRGAFAGIRDIVKEISNTFLPVIDPADKAAGMEKTFRNVRNMVIDFGESMIKAAVKVYDWFRKSARDLMQAVDSAELFTAKALKRTVTGYNIFTGEEGRSLLSRGLISEDEFKGLGERIKQLETQKKKIDDFKPTNITEALDVINKVRQKAAAADIKRDMELNAEINAKAANAAKGLANNAADMGKAAAEAAAKFDLARKSMEQFALDLESEFASPIQRFNKDLEDSRTRLEEARQKLAGRDDKLLERVEAGMKRKVTARLSEFLKENDVGTSWQAARAEKGSAAAMEAMLRNRFGEAGKDIQQRIKAALDRANELAKAQLDQQRLMIQAINAARPGVLVFGK